MIMKMPDDLVTNSDVEKMLEYLKHNKPSVDGAMTLCLATFTVLAKEHGMETWESVEVLTKGTFEKSLKAFKDICILSGPKH